MLPSAKAGTCHVSVLCLSYVPVGGDGDMLCDFVRVSRAGGIISPRVVRWYKATA
jgi:hypothetical protein